MKKSQYNVYAKLVKALQAAIGAGPLDIQNMSEAEKQLMDTLQVESMKFANIIVATTKG